MMEKYKAREILEDLLISLHNHLIRATEEVDKIRTQNRIDALKVFLKEK